MPETIIITGGQGFVGQHLLAELQHHRADTQVVIWDQPDVDITDPATYQQRLLDLQPDWIIHLAGIAAVQAGLHNPKLVHRVNAEGTRLLLEAVRANSSTTRVLAISSADIYGTAAATANGAPVKELPLIDVRPLNPYAASKVAMERYIEDRFNDFVIRVRPFPHIGPHQQRGFVTADFAAQIAAIERGEQLPTIKVGNLTAQRDFTDVRDVVRAYRLLLEHGQLGEVYNVATGVPISIQKILDELLGLTMAQITIEEDPDKIRPVDTPILVGDATKLRELTEWQPEIPLTRSLHDILDFWRRS